MIKPTKNKTPYQNVNTPFSMIETRNLHKKNGTGTKRNGIFKVRKSLNRISGKFGR